MTPEPGPEGLSEESEEPVRQRVAGDWREDEEAAMPLTPSFIPSSLSSYEELF